ncbi:MAG: acyl-CoA synthetase [Pseudomonadota bacterium]
MLETKPITGLGDVEILEQTPWEEVIPAESTYELLADQAARRPDDTAMTFLLTGAVDENPIRIPYKLLIQRINQAANMFAGLGVGPTDVVSFLLPLLPQAQYVLWGAEAAGIANPINFLLNPDQIADLLNAAETKVLVALGPNPALDIWEKVEAVRDRVPSLKAILSVFGPGDESRNIYSFDQLIEKYPGDRLTSGRKFSRHEIAAYFHTGGTTGAPKLARQTHGNQVYAAWAIANFWQYKRGDIAISGLPLFHVAGAFVVSLAPLASGLDLVIPTPAGLRNPTVVENHWRLVEKYRVNVIGGVPTSLGALLNVPVGEADISRVERALTGGSALPVQVEKDFRSVFGLKIYQMYGQTESTVIISMNPVLGEPRIGSVGLRIPYQQWKIVRLTSRDFSEECEVREPGMLMVKGPNVFAGYLDPAQNKGVLTEDGWLVTGDLGYFDEDGWLYLTGRAKDLIVRSGHNIDPSIIEESLMEHPAVNLAAAIGKPDTYAGELPVAYVQLKPGASVAPGDLMNFVADRISERPAKPKEIIIIDQMPMTGVGKIFKPALRLAQAKAVFTEALGFLQEQGLRYKVEVEDVKGQGTAAVITLAAKDNVDRAAVEKAAAEAIGRFTYVHHRVEWT